MDYIIQNEKNNADFMIEIEQRARDTSGSFVDELIKVRHELGMTQQDVADLAGVPRAAISRIERKQHSPSIETMLRYANALGKNVKISLIDK